MKSFIFLAVCLINCDAAVITQDVINNRPMIGILSQEQSEYFQKKYPKENYTSYIAASYVKAVEASGARVVPIMIGKNRTYYEDLLSKLNGVLLPGGSTYFNQSDGYADAGQHIYEIATSMNEAGDYFPILGTCLGMELMIVLASGRGQENRVKCWSFENRRLHFVEDFRDSKMFKTASDDVIDILKNEDVTYNAHSFCILDDNLKSHNLTDWRVTSHSQDANGVQFIASIEHTKYPFFGVQFHPEKIAFEWKASKNYPSGRKAVLANRLFLDFFVDECRKSQHVFASAAEENEYVIYNYKPLFTGVLGSAYHQCYFFEPRGTLGEIDNDINPLIVQ